jgi:RimJ/RimL family protein N-acetyltransferase
MGIKTSLPITSLMQHKSFVSERLQFRPLRKEDADLLFPHITEDITHHWIGWEYPKSYEECEDWIKKIMKRDGTLFLTFSLSTNTFVGVIGTDWIQHTQEYELDIWVCKNMQNKGYATEMLQRFLAWLKENTKLKYVIYSYTQGNKASRLLLKKFPHTFARKEWEHKNGKRVYTQNFFVPLD